MKMPIGEEMSLALPLGPLIAVGLTGWVAVDAARRQRNWYAWAGLVALTGIFGAITWLIVRRRSTASVSDLGVRRSLMVVLTAFPLFLLAVVMPAALSTFLFQTARVEGDAMSPTLRHRDRLIVNKRVYRLHDPKRGDIVMLLFPLNPARSFVKRVIATEGDQVRIVGGRVYCNGVPADDSFVPAEYRSRDDWGPVVVPQGYYFVMGDRRNDSSDSRHWGFVPKKYILGKVQCRWWPVSAARVF
jgi:signal peptidase I